MNRLLAFIALFFIVCSMLTATEQETSQTQKDATTATPAPIIKLPANGIFIGSGVYNGHQGIYSAGRCFTRWGAPNSPNAKNIVKLCIQENQGNLLEIWMNGQMLLDVIREAKEAGLYSMAFYSNANEKQVGELKDFGEFYLGDNFGERFTISFYASSAKYDKDMSAADAWAFSLENIADALKDRVKQWVDTRHNAGWGLVMATSSNYYLDYEIAAGVDVPCTEDYPFGNLTTASALNRGLYRSFNLPIWGSHLAHEWYSYLPHKNKYKMESLRTAMLLKYMTGAKIIVNESGNWTLQGTLCEDSPMQTLPRTGDKLNGGVQWKRYREMNEEAKKLFANIDFRSPVATEYRKIISDFYNFTKANPAPLGQPEATIGIVKGNLDLSSGSDPTFGSNDVIACAYRVAEHNPNWKACAPEKSFKLLENVLFPRPKMFLPNKNIHFGATPYGQADIVSFVDDRVTADFLINNYRVLIFSGWNTCSVKQYQTLAEYVKAGGKLCIALPHLSTNKTRKHDTFDLKELVNGGDFSELCGLKVKGKGSRFYWATGPDKKQNELGMVLARRFGIIGAPLGELEFTNPPENYEMLAVDDEDMRPVIVRCKSGKGEVYFVNTWCYPAAINRNEGPGATDDDRGLADRLFEFAAMQGRGHVWITGNDFETPDEDCKWLVFSYFPDAGKILFLNLDYERPHNCILHYFGAKKHMSLKPGEFLQLDAPKLQPHEKYNQR